LLEHMPPSLRPMADLAAASLTPEMRALLDERIAVAWEAARRGDLGPALELGRAVGLTEAQVRGAIDSFAEG
jgi:hypothetical protein